MTDQGELPASRSPVSGLDETRSPAARLPPEDSPRREASSRRLSQGALSVLTGSMAVIPLIGLTLMVLVLALEAWPSIKLEGLHFLTSATWSIGNTYGTPVRTGGVLHAPGASFGALYIIIGTLEASGIALLIGFPLAIGCAVIVVEKLPPRLSSVIGMALDTLAGIPSVIYGLWGFLTLGPFLSAHVYPVLAKLPNVPVLNIFRGNVSGEGLFTTGLVLAVMIVPIIAATSRDLLRQVPDTTKEGATALGMTPAEGFRSVQYRWVRSGVVAAAILGLGRALGETIAVAMVSGSEIALPHNIYGSMTTIAATIVSQLDSAFTDPTMFAVKGLAEAALLLMLITLIVNLAARLLVRKFSASTALPVGAGF